MEPAISPATGGSRRTHAGDGGSGSGSSSGSSSAMALAAAPHPQPHPLGLRLVRPPSRARRPSSALTAQSRELRARGDRMCGALKRARHVIARVS